MKTLGLLGGMSWESTAIYYRLLNQAAKERLGGLHSARLVLWSVDFHELEEAMRAGNWDAVGSQLAAAARALEAAGAEGLLLTSNTLHRVAPAIESAVGIPFLDLIELTAAEIRRAGLARVGLLGTRFTMEEDFYRARLEQDGDVEVLVPDAGDRALVDRVIFEELCRGRIEAASRTEFRRILAALAARGAQGVVLGCTELGLLVGAGDAPVPLFDTTLIHATRAADWALGDGSESSPWR
jgi:aspartate racemase